MSWLIKIEKGEALLSDQFKAIPIVRKVFLRDKAKGKASFKMWMRYVYYAYSKDSIYKNYLPREREGKVVDTIFPTKTVTYFKSIAGMKQLIDFYIEASYSFKELLYRRLLIDVEQTMDRLSKVELTTTSRVKGKRDITFFSKTEKANVTETVDIDVRISIDNSAEKEKSMVLLDKLLERETKLKKALKEEEIQNQLKEASSRRLYDK